MENLDQTKQPLPQIAFDPAKFDRWVIQAADATITEEDLESLLRMCLPPEASVDFLGDEALKRRLETAINSYCHIVRITREYRDQDVDWETSLGLVAKRERGEPYTDEEIRIIGKRSSNSEADLNLDRAFWGVVKVIEGLPLKQSAPFVVIPIEFYTTLSGEQFCLLAESLFEQAIVQGTGSVTDKADFAASASECPKLARKLFIAHGISLLTEGHDWALRRSKLSPEERADEDRIMERLQWAIYGPVDPQAGDS